MKVCIVGAGAVGGLIGTRLAVSGAEVSALARGETLAALRTHGWRLKQGDRLLSAPASALSSDARELGPQDLVVVAVKAPVTAALAGSVVPLLGPSTIVLPAMNGVPWWFIGSRRRLDSVDPGGAVAGRFRSRMSSAASCISAARDRAPGVAACTSSAWA